MCILMLAGGYECGWTLIISPNLTCDGIPMDGCTYYDQKIIYLTQWDGCIFLHELSEHAQKENYQRHYMTDCWGELQAEREWNAYMKSIK